MNLEEQRQFILSGKVYNDLTPELVKARENKTDIRKRSYPKKSFKINW